MPRLVLVVTWQRIALWETEGDVDYLDALGIASESVYIQEFFGMPQIKHTTYYFLAKSTRTASVICLV